MLSMIYSFIATTWFDGIINIIEAACAIGNILLLIYFTNREWKYSNQKEQAQKNANIEYAKLERQKIWYDKIVIERIIEYLLEYFDSNDKDLSAPKAQKEDEKKHIIDGIKVRNRRYKHLVIPCLEIFSHKLAQDINRMLQDYFDIITKEIGNNTSFYSPLFERNVNDKKGEILKKIYDFDFSNNLNK